MNYKKDIKQTCKKVLDAVLEGNLHSANFEEWFNATYLSKLTLSFWFMHDNHTFTQAQGNNMDEIMDDFKAIAKDSPHGMVTMPTVLDNNKQIDRIGRCVNVDKDGNVDLTEWYNAIKDNDLIKNFGK